jgi:hypothetical protein
MVKQTKIVYMPCHSSVRPVNSNFDTVRVFPKKNTLIFYFSQKVTDKKTTGLPTFRNLAKKNYKMIFFLSKPARAVLRSTKIKDFLQITKEKIWTNFKSSFKSFLSFYFLWTELIWSIDFVIPKKFFFIDFLDKLELFLGEKQVFTKKKVRHSAVCREFMAVQMRILSTRFLKDPFELDTSPFGSLKKLVQLELFLYFWPREQIPSCSCHTNFWPLFYFHVKIDQF